jgi:hypothetical protein
LASGCGEEIKGHHRTSEGLASKRKHATTEGKGKEKKEKGFLFLKSNKQMNSNANEFKHIKPMHQHVCNIKLL